MREIRVGKRLRAAGVTMSLAGVAAALFALLTPATALAQAQGIGVDRQDYVADAGPDAYSANNASFGGSAQSPDQVDVHVGAAPGKSTYHSYFRLEIDSIPQGAPVTSLVLTLHPDDGTLSPESYNGGTYTCVNSTECAAPSNGAFIDAYPLKESYPSPFDPSNPPAFDTSAPKAVGQYHSADASWTFELAPLITYWQEHGNTGLAVVPDTAQTQSPWEINFFRGATTAKAQFSPPAGTTSTGGVSLTYTAGPASAVPAVTLPQSEARALPPPAAAAPARTPAPQRPATGATAARPVVPSGFVPLWLLVIAVCAAAAIALLAQPVSQALAASAGIGPALTTQLRLHPRMFAVAAVLLAWSSTFGVYSNTLGRPFLNSAGYSTAGGNGSGSGPTAAGSTTPGAQASAGTAAGGSSTAAGATGAAGSAVLYPNSPNPPSANLFAPNAETVGLTSSQIFLCAHAALTFGPAFNIGASDLNVFWQMVNDQGGIWGRKLYFYDSQGNLQPGINFIDDSYQPYKAVQAAASCQEEQGGDFFLLGGIGFDQIPAVRVWAEENHILYIHHIALQAGSDGMRYSFTMLPTLELAGQQFGQYYISHFAGQKIGIIERNSSNWAAGSTTFKQTLQQAGYGSDIVADDQVQNNQGQYAQEISDMEVKGAQTVLIWENALAAENIIQQANGQNYHPNWLLFPFNLTLNNLNTAKVPVQDLEKMYGLWPDPAYTCHAAGLPQYSAYAQEIRQFEAAYQKYDSSGYNNLCGDGGDLLFSAWEAWKQVYDLLYDCGRDCTRDKIAGLMLSGYHATVGANCPVDFRGGDGHHGGYDEDLYRVAVINGSPGWVDDQPLCQRNVS